MSQVERVGFNMALKVASAQNSTIRYSQKNYKLSGSNTLVLTDNEMKPK